jgi:hypothetical protein
MVSGRNLFSRKEETLNRFFLKLRHFEFWNTHLFHLPVYLYWLYLSCRSRSLFFFSAANPGIETGGLIGESKFNILRKIAPVYYPKTVLFSSVPTVEKVFRDLGHESISFPFVVKPDIGQGGWMTELIQDSDDLTSFLSRIKMPFLVQEYVDDPIELGILYYRFPGKSQGIISSIAVKDLLSVTGDGVSTVRELLQRHPRARRRVEQLLAIKKTDPAKIPWKGEKVWISFLGNHSYGTVFKDGSHLIDAHLTSVFDNVCKNIAGFYFGRFDLRCKSIADLRNGRFKILELNGVGSEPLHIFDPSSNVFNAYACSFRHWKTIYEISKINRRQGFRYMSLTEALKTLKRVMYIQQIHQRAFVLGN